MAPAAKRIIEQAKRLPVRERRRVISALEASLPPPADSSARSTRRGSCDALLALAGTAHADVRDVSTDKYRHVAAVFADDDA